MKMGSNLDELLLKGEENFWRGQKMKSIRKKRNNKANPNITYKLLKKTIALIYLKFSELNSDSKNFRNCSLPTGSFKASSMPNPHRFTLCCPGSLLRKKKQQNSKWAILQYSNNLCSSFRLSSKVPWFSHFLECSYLCNVQHWANRLLVLTQDEGNTQKKKDFQLGMLSDFKRFLFCFSP